MATIKDIANMCNCSPTTVSFIMNNHPLAEFIADSTKERVLRAVEEMGYIPNTYARMLRNKNPRTVGIVSFDINDPYCIAVLRGIEECLNERNFFYQLADVRNDLELLHRFLQDAKSRYIDGIIGIFNSLTIDPGELKSYFAKELTLVSIGRVIPELKISSVMLDNPLGARLGVEHLHALGHRDIAFLIGPRETEDSRTRFDGIVKACRELGVPVDDNLVETITDLPATYESGAAAIGRLLDRGARMTAVFCYDDMTAYGVILELSRRGLRVPEDISVVGFDDLWPSAMYNPPLTTIRQPMNKMGVAGAEMIVNILAKPPKERPQLRHTIVMEPELVIRGTTTTPPAAAKKPARKKGRRQAAAIS